MGSTQLPFLFLFRKNNACEDLLHLQHQATICFSKAHYSKKHRGHHCYTCHFSDHLHHPSLPGRVHYTLCSLIEHVLLYWVFFLFSKTGFLYSFVACPGTCSVYQAGLKLRDLHASASQMLIFKASVTTSWHKATIERTWLWPGGGGTCL